MIENLKLILNMMNDYNVSIPQSKFKACVVSLETAIEILEKFNRY